MDKKDNSTDNVYHVNFSRGHQKPTQDPDTLGSHESKWEEIWDHQGLITLGSTRKLIDFTEIIGRGTVLVTLDARFDTVTVPEEFSSRGNLNLSFDHRYNIADFSYDSSGVRASLSFSGIPQWCDIPWDAIYAMQCREADIRKVYIDSIPADYPDYL